MLSAAFKSSVVTQRDGGIVIAFFDRGAEPVVLLRCEEEAARALVTNLGSALHASDNRPGEKLPNV